MQLTIAALFFLGGCNASRTPIWPREHLITTDLEPEAVSQGDVLDDNPADGEPEAEHNEVDDPKHMFISECETLLAEIKRFRSPQNVNRGDTTPWQLGYWPCERDGSFENTWGRRGAKRRCKETLLAWGREVDSAHEASRQYDALE